MESVDKDVVIAESTSPSELEDKPLKMLFKRLLTDGWNKQNTVLSDAQIIEILHKEFNMDIIYVHELEIDIYLNIVKTFLKDWPQWDEIDSAINLLKSQNNTKKIQKMLESNYESLKMYLRKTLETVDPLLKQTIKEVKEATKKEAETSDSDIVMRLQCTRKQLNHLFYRRPHPLHNNTIFNVLNRGPKRMFYAYDLETMLNWPSILTTINLGEDFCVRRGVYLTLHHVLVNKKLNYPKKPEILNTNYQMQKISNPLRVPITPFELSSFLSTVDEIAKIGYPLNETKQLVQTVCNLIKLDFANAPLTVFTSVTYRKFLCQSPYVRYLYSEVNAGPCISGNNYDLQLEETAKPQVKLNISKFKKFYTVPTNGDFLKVECQFCAVPFVGAGIVEQMKQHFEKCHRGEPDWKCEICKTTFAMEYLAKNKWKHACIPKLDD